VSGSVELGATGGSKNDCGVVTEAWALPVDGDRAGFACVESAADMRRRTSGMGGSSAPLPVTWALVSTMMAVASRARVELPDVASAGHVGDGSFAIAIAL
jgi:hypothetical protein